jgi:hypothetical protein
MNFDVGTVQGKSRKFYSVNDLRLKIFFDAVEDALVDPATKTLIDGAPFSEVLGDGTPFTPVFGDVLQGAKKGEIVYLHIATLPGKQVFDAIHIVLESIS